MHPAAKMYQSEHAAGQLSRREFFSRVTSLGVTSTAAYGLLGLTAPARAETHVQTGGTLRIQMPLRPLRDPRTFDATEFTYMTAGWLEYLVAYDNDGTFTPMLLSGWDVNPDATQYTLHVRPGVTWNDGTPFTATDVARNIRGWCDKSVPGNSMAARFAVLIDETTGQVRDGAVKILNPMTVLLTLPHSDVTLIASMSDYPAAVTPAGFDAETMLENPIGTGPYLPESHIPGTSAALVRNTAHTWWGTAAGRPVHLDRIEYFDLGSDPSDWVAAAAAGDVDMLFETVGDFIPAMDDLGWQESHVASGATICIRPNQQAETDGFKPYADVRVRRAIAMAVDPEICLELGYASRGVPAENTHVGPMHPEYAHVPPLPYDPDGARALLAQVGMTSYKMNLTSIDDDWRKNTADAVAAQLRDAGFNVARTIIPVDTFWDNWTKYPFSATDWNHRPLGIQTLALAYRSGEAWNESGFANPEFDALIAAANALADANDRRIVMEMLQTILRDEAVILQPYWRSLYRHARPGVAGFNMHIAYHPRLTDLGLTG